MASAPVILTHERGTVKHAAVWADGVGYVPLCGTRGRKADVGYDGVSPLRWCMLCQLVVCALEDAMLEDAVDHGAVLSDG